MPQALPHYFGRSPELSIQNQLLFSCYYQAAVPQHKTLKPYPHLLSTLSGNLLSLYRPADHPWHAGLLFAISLVSGDNFWEGNAFDSERGYVG